MLPHVLYGPLHPLGFMAVQAPCAPVVHEATEPTMAQGLGVAPEIRPLLMRCNSARQRLKVAKAGVDASIRSLEALKNSWWRRAFRFILSNTSSKLWFALLVCLVAVVVDRGTGRGTANTAAPSADSVGN